MFKATIIIMALMGSPEPQVVGVLPLDPVYETTEACRDGGQKWVDENKEKIKAEADQKKIKVVGGIISCDPVEDRKI